MTSKDTIKIAVSGMFIALVIVATFINVPFPGAVGGLVHLGTLMLLIIAMRFGRYYGALAGGIGMGLFDTLGGYGIWILGTFIVRLIMGFVVGQIADDAKKGQGKSIYKNILAWCAGIVIMLIGYYLYEAIFITDFNAALLSVWGNLIQFGIGILAIPIVTYTMNNKAFDDIYDRIKLTKKQSK
jgi:uncharacterized membrane protein